MKRRHFILVVVVVVAATVLGLSRVGTRRASAEDKASSGEQWEYLCVGNPSNVNFTPTDNSSMRKESGGFGREDFVLEGNLDKLGKNSWELVTVTESQRLGPTFIFKRRR